MRGVGGKQGAEVRAQGVHTPSPAGEEQHQWGGASCLVRGSCRRQGGGCVGPTWYSRPSGEKVVVRESYRRLPMVVCRAWHARGGDRWAAGAANFNQGY